MLQVMGTSVRVNSRYKYLLLLGLVLLVIFTVIARPSALLTFGLIALAGSLPGGATISPNTKLMR